MRITLNSYNNIIKLLENEKRELTAKVYSKNVFVMINRKHYINKLNKVDNILYNRYCKVGQMITEDIK
ncbi:MAG: hypothetical protein Q4G04_03620 [bacterium]|nr:hypothetical protein [bacterium]